MLRRLVEECLDYDPTMRPTMATVCERIEVSKDVYMKEFPQDVITAHQEVEQLRAEIVQQKIENDWLKNENEQQRAAMV